MAGSVRPKYRNAHHGTAQRHAQTTIPRRHHIVNEEKKMTMKIARIEHGVGVAQCTMPPLNCKRYWFFCVQSVIYCTSCVDAMRCSACAHRPRRGARFRSTRRKTRINNRSYVRRDNSRIPQNWRQSQSVSIVSIAQSSMLVQNFELVHVRKYKRAANSGIHRRKTLMETKRKTANRPTDRPTKNEYSKTTTAGMRTGKYQHIHTIRQ